MKACFKLTNKVLCHFCGRWHMELGSGRGGDRDHLGCCRGGNRVRGGGDGGVWRRRGWNKNEEVFCGEVGEGLVEVRRRGRMEGAGDSGQSGIVERWQGPG